MENSGGSRWARGSIEGSPLHPDVVIMDINMPPLNGLEAARQMHKQIPRLPVVLLSGYAADELVDKALETGVRGYVVKTDAAKDLMAAVQAVLQGRPFFTASMSRRLMENMRHLATREKTALTVHEAEIIPLLCTGKAIRKWPAISA